MNKRFYLFDFITYLLLNIEWHEQIRDEAFNDFDRRWKQGQIDLLQRMADDLLGTGLEYSILDQILIMMKDMEKQRD